MKKRVLALVLALALLLPVLAFAGVSDEEAIEDYNSFLTAQENQTPEYLALKETIMDKCSINETQFIGAYKAFSMWLMGGERDDAISNDEAPESLYLYHTLYNGEYVDFLIINQKDGAVYCVLYDEQGEKKEIASGKVTIEKAQATAEKILSGKGYIMYEVPGKWVEAFAQSPKTFALINTFESSFE